MFIADNQIDRMHQALQMCRDAKLEGIIGLDTIEGDVCKYVCTYKGGRQVCVDTVRYTITAVEEFVFSEGVVS